jgi:hypothetical protein
VKTATPTHSQTPAPGHWRRFAQAATAGAIAGFAFLVAPIVIVPATLLLLWALATPPRSVKTAGVLIGAGVTIVVALLTANQRCLAQGSSSASGCAAPDITAFLVAGAVLVGVGIVVGTLPPRLGKDHQS